MSLRINCSSILSSVSHLDFFRQRNIPTSDMLYKILVRIEHHNMKVLNSMYAFQRAPVLEPDHIIPPTNSNERSVDKIVNLSSSFRRKITIGVGVRDCASYELEFCPDHEMDNSCVDAVGPVVVEDLVVSCSTS